MILSDKWANRLPETPFAFFDFDGTLTRSDTLMPFLHHTLGAGYYAKLLKVAPVLLGYLAKIIPNDVAKERVLTECLGQMTQELLFQAAFTFVRDELPQRLLPVGMAKLHEHQQQGHICVLVSASPECYLIEWAQQHGFDGILGTQLATISGRITGKIDGQNCFGAEKVIRIEAEYGTDCWQNSFAYSDSRSDMPMLAKAAHGFLLKNQQFQPI